MKSSRARSPQIPIGNHDQKTIIDDIRYSDERASGGVTYMKISLRWQKTQYNRPAAREQRHAQTSDAAQRSKYACRAVDSRRPLCGCGSKTSLTRCAQKNHCIVLEKMARGLTAIEQAPDKIPVR